MKKHPFSLITYTSDDGKTSQQVWNGKDGVVPDIITLPNGKPGSITSAVVKGPGWTPPEGTTEITHQPPAPTQAGVQVGWPGTPYLGGSLCPIR